MHLPWYLAALGAAIIWGMHYPLIDFAMKRLSVYTVLLISVIPIVAALPFFIDDVSKDIDTFKLLPNKEQFLVLVVALTSTMGALLLYLSIDGKNATLASLIEITYPVFVVIFAYVFFREIHINASVLLGGILVLTGSVLIIYHNN